MDIFTICLAAFVLSSVKMAYMVINVNNLFHISVQVSYHLGGDKGRLIHMDSGHSRVCHSALPCIIHMHCKFSNEWALSSSSILQCMCYRYRTMLYMCYRQRYKWMLLFQSFKLIYSTVLLTSFDRLIVYISYIALLCT